MGSLGWSGGGTAGKNCRPAKRWPQKELPKALRRSQHAAFLHFCHNCTLHKVLHLPVPPQRGWSKGAEVGWMKGDVGHAWIGTGGWNGHGMVGQALTRNPSPQDAFRGFQTPQASVCFSIMTQKILPNNP